jgi:hypothetical protein
LIEKERIVFPLNRNANRSSPESEKSRSRTRMKAEVTTRVKAEVTSTRFTPIVVQKYDISAGFGLVPAAL